MVRKNLLKGLTLPKSIEYSVEEEKGEYLEYAKIVAYPFERGFGITIGNALRRVLLSSIQGFAVSAISFTVHTKEKTYQISNQFETLPGVKEDIIEIIANIKKLQIRVEGDDTDSILFTIECRGSGVIKGSDFEKNNVKITNPDLVIFTADSDANVDLEVQIDFGRGYIPADLQARYQEQHGVIAIDSLFSPVKRVNYTVEPTRVGQRNDFDKLVLEVWTNGSLSAKDAVGQAAFIAEKYFATFVNFDDKAVIDTEKFEEEDSKRKKIFKSSIDILELSARSSNCLKRVNISLISELVKKTEADLSSVSNFGEKSLLEIKEKLAGFGLKLGMRDADINSDSSFIR